MSPHTSIVYPVLHGTLYEMLCSVSCYKCLFLLRSQMIFVLHYVYSSYIRFIMGCSFLITITSVWIGVKACHALCFPLKVGRSAMACFRLLRSGYVGMIWKSYAYTIRKWSYCIVLFSIIMVCDLYFNSHILLCLCITLILILYIISIKCVYVREY